MAGRFRFLTLVSISILMAAAFVYGQPIAPLSENEKLLNLRLETVRIKIQGTGNLFSRLALRFDIPIGVELGRNEEDLRFYQLNVKTGSLTDVMAQAIRVVNNGPNRYTWEIRNGVVRVFPEKKFRNRDLEAVLETRIDTFRMEKNTACDTFIELLMADRKVKKAIAAENITFRPTTTGGFYFPQMGREFELTARNMKVESILDKAVKESPIANFWVIWSGRSERAFYVYLSAWQEDTPKEWRKSPPFDPEDLEKTDL